MEKYYPHKRMRRGWEERLNKETQEGREGGEGTCHESSKLGHWSLFSPLFSEHPAVFSN